MANFKNPWEAEPFVNPWATDTDPPKSLFRKMKNALDKGVDTYNRDTNKKVANPYGNNLYIAIAPRNGHSMQKIAQTAQDILDNAGINVQVRYFDLSKMDNANLDRIITRKCLADSDGLVFVGHGADIDMYVVSRIMLKDDAYPDHFFSNAQGKIEGGDTSQSDLKCKNNPSTALKRAYYYSAYEIGTFENKKLSLNSQDMYLGRGVIHEWTHQIMLNNFKEKTGEGHSSNSLLLSGGSADRYKNETEAARKTPNIMIAGNDFSEKNNPSLEDTVFKFLRTDIHYIKAALGGASIPIQTAEMQKIKTMVTKNKNPGR